MSPTSEGDYQCPNCFRIINVRRACKCGRPDLPTYAVLERRRILSKNAEALWAIVQTVTGEDGLIASIEHELSEADFKGESAQKQAEQRKQSQ